MTQVDAWTGLGLLAPADLKDAALQLHWAVQYLAAAGQTFSEPQPNDSHRTATWNAERREFVSAQFAGPYPFRVALRPADLTLQLLDRTTEPLGTFPSPASRARKASSGCSRACPTTWGDSL